MKKLLLILLILSSFYVKGDIHQIQVWNGYYQFLPSNNITVQLGDTVQWVQLDPPTMTHTITSDNIPNGAIPFNQIWQLPADTFFQYIPQVVGLYQYVCTPHIPFGMIGEFTVVNGPQTYVPDDNFEQALINLGYDTFLDDYVTTASINTINTLDVNNMNIASLIGIEDFIGLKYLYCGLNQLTSLDLSNNINLENLHCPENTIATIDFSNSVSIMHVNCENNQIYSLDISQNSLLGHLELKDNNLFFLNLKNGANNLLNHMRVTDNPNLTCISVDDSLWATNNWNVFQDIDPQQYFSNNCSTTGIEELSTNKKILKVTDLLGRETKQTNQPLFYIYDDGAVEKKIVIE